MPNRQMGAKSGWVRRDARKIWTDFHGADRVEAYLRRAMDAENKATAGCDKFRQEMIELAMQWRDLARLAESVSDLDGPNGAQPNWRVRYY